MPKRRKRRRITRSDSVHALVQGRQAMDQNLEMNLSLRRSTPIISSPIGKGSVAEEDRLKMTSFLRTQNVPNLCVPQYFEDRNRTPIDLKPKEIRLNIPLHLSISSSSRDSEDQSESIRYDVQDISPGKQRPSPVHNHGSLFGTDVACVSIHADGGESCPRPDRHFRRAPKIEDLMRLRNMRKKDHNLTAVISVVGSVRFTVLQYKFVRDLITGFPTAHPMPSYSTAHRYFQEVIKHCLPHNEIIDLRTKKAGHQHGDLEMAVNQNVIHRKTPILNPI